MKILAIDIGGTYSRFGHFEVNEEEPLIPLSLYRTLTQNNNIHSFNDLLLDFLKNKPGEFLELQNYDAIGLAVPGPVYKNACLPPNISWQIKAANLNTHKPVFMLNDFAAQAYACLLPEIKTDLELIKQGEPDQAGAIAIIGAGTGLGHSTLVPNGNGHYSILASEAGHAQFGFIDGREKAFEGYLKKKLNIEYCVNDNVINGRGLSLLHEFLTKKVQTPEEIFDNKKQHQQTLSIFASFYARSARNYCLNNMITNALIISGGLASKNPDLINTDVFLREFVNSTSKSYVPLLESLPIYLNKKDELGLIGMAHFMKKQLLNQH